MTKWGLAHPSPGAPLVGNGLYYAAMQRWLTFKDCSRAGQQSWAMQRWLTFKDCSRAGLCLYIYEIYLAIKGKKELKQQHTPTAASPRRSFTTTAASVSLKKTKVYAKNKLSKGVPFPVGIRGGSSRARADEDGQTEMHAGDDFQNDIKIFEFQT
jgi:hypothetical protein